MKILKKQLVITIIFVMTFFAVGINVTATSSTNIVVNGEEFHANEEVVILNGRTYIPVRDFTELLGAYVQWDSESREVYIAKGDDSINFKIDSAKVLFNSETMYMDSKAVILNGYTYAPVRFVAEAFKHEVNWIAETSTVSIDEFPTYIVKEGDTLALISEALELNIDDFMLWNQLTTDEIFPEQKLYLKPMVLKSVDETKTVAVCEYTEEEFEWLAKIIYAEADDEPYLGLVAVGAVVINRVEDSWFPNSIYDVIFQPSQFSPVKNGRIYNINPDSEAYQAAEDALMGVNPVECALYFNNPVTSRYSSFFNSKQVITNIGNHRFYQ